MRPDDGEVRGGLAERGEHERRVAIRRRVEVALDERIDVALAPDLARDLELRKQRAAHRLVERERRALPLLAERGVVGRERHRLRLDAVHLVVGGALGEILDLVGLAVERLALGGVAFGEGVDDLVLHVRQRLLPERGGEVVLRRKIATRVERGTARRARGARRARCPARCASVRMPHAKRLYGIASNGGPGSQHRVAERHERVRTDRPVRSSAGCCFSASAIAS